MTSYKRDITLHPVLYRRILTQRNLNQLTCERCGKEIVPEKTFLGRWKKIVSKLSAGRVRMHTRYWHKSCYEEMYIEC